MALGRGPLPEHVPQRVGPFADERHRATLFLAFSRSLLPLAVLLGVAVLAPVIAFLCITLQAIALLTTGLASASDLLLVVANAIAVAMPGAGAYSVDAWLFGRRVIVVTMDRHSHNS